MSLYLQKCTIISTYRVLFAHMYFIATFTHSCAMGCTFCATGTMGIRGNLCSGEILEQMVHASRILASDADNKGDKSKPELIRNIVFMGMGEPLNK